jgi:hypothetical protein
MSALDRSSPINEPRDRGFAKLIAYALIPLIGNVRCKGAIVALACVLSVVALFPLNARSPQCGEGATSKDR